MNEEKVREAFSRAKKDIHTLQSQISELTTEIKQLKRTLDQTDTSDRQTDRHKTQTVPQEIGGFSSPNLAVSTGNEGVQTDRQTIRQTDRHGQKFAQTSSETSQQTSQQDPITQAEKVSEVLNSLNTLKRDLRSQFKKLTPQEMFVFSTIYQLTEQGLEVDYSLVAEKTHLTQSSIRDYIQKIIQKNIPLIKSKDNNKRIILSIPSDFKSMASLQTILSLRDL